MTVLLYSGIATAAAYAVGLLVGMVAGYSRTWLDPVLMRLTDVLLAFPALVFLLLLATAFGSGVTGIVLATAIIQLPPIIRIVRSATLEQSVRGYVEAAVTRGEGTFAVLRREILPNIARPLSRTSASCPAGRCCSSRASISSALDCNRRQRTGA